MKKFLIEQSEKEAILKMHGFLKEEPQQPEPQQTMSDVDKLKLALQTCIKNYKWFTPDPTSPIRRTKGGKDIIIGTGSNGNTYYFYADLIVVNASTGAKKTWDCDFKPLPVTPTPEKPITLNDDQKDVIARIAKDGWVTQPKPSQVAIDNKEAEAADLTDSNSILGRIYAKYFPKDQFPKGYFVYRKVVKQEPTPGAAEEIQISGEMCKTAINSLYRHMESPNSVPLSNAQINSYVDVAQKCAEPANRKRFRFGMNKQLEKIARKYGIEIR